MFIVFKKVLFGSLFLVSMTIYGQEKVQFNYYLKGDYNALRNSKEPINLLYLASAHTHLDQFSKAERTFLSVKEELRNSALYLNESGFLLLKMYQLDAAKMNFEKALETSKKTQDKEGTRLALTNLALYHFAVGNFDLQYDFAKKALEESIKIYGPKTVITARMYNNLALALSGLGKNKESLKNYKLALGVYKTQKDRYINPYICRVKINIALLKLAQKDFLSAEKLALDALNFTNNESSNAIFVNLSLSDIYIEKKKLVAAENHLIQALRINQKDHVKEHIDIYNKIANVARLKKNYKKALLYLDSAISINILDTTKITSSENLLSLEASLSSHYIKGHIHFDRHYVKSLKPKDLKLAVTSFEKCLLLLDKERNLRITQKDKIRLGTISKVVYDKLIKSCYDLSINTFKKSYYDEQVFLHIQQSKGSVLNASMNENSALHFSGVPAKTIKKERRLKARLMYFEQLVAIHTSEKSYRDSLANLRISYSEFITELEKSHPRYFDLKYQKKENKKENIQKVLSEKKIICSYYLTSDARNIYAAFLDKQQLKIYEVYVGDHLLSDIIKMRNFIFYRVYKGYNEVSNRLFELLIPDKKIIEGRSIVFFPDGQLNMIPFGALSVIKNRRGKSWADETYFIQKNPLSYGMSTAIYEPYDLGSLNEYALFAPVTFNYNEIEKYQSLPFTKNEVLAIDSVTKSEETKVSLYIGDEVTKKKITSTTANVIHLATHGLIDQNHPELSKLCLSPTSEGGFLYNNEIYNLKINSDLVTMSACETGLGKLSKGEGMIGLTRAWVYAGTKNLMVSYWSVSDMATSLLMTHFYNNVSHSYSFTSSLQIAKLNLLEHEETQAPYFWAGFVLVGE